MSRTRKTSGQFGVGYGKPPTHSRFKPGSSGNPAGRRKKPAGVHEQITKLLERKIGVPEHGVTRMMSVQETMFLAIAQKAIKGDLKAVAFLLNLREATRGSDEITIDPASLADFDRMTLRHYLDDVLAREAKENGNARRGAEATDVGKACVNGSNEPGQKDSFDER